MLYFSVLGMLKYSIGWRPQEFSQLARIELQMNCKYFSKTINVDTGLNHENWAKLRELSYKWMLKIINKNINIIKGSKSHKLSPKHILPIEMVKSMGSNRKDIKKMSLELICSSVLAIWLNFHDRWWRQCGDIEDSHHLPCNLPIHWNVTNASSRTATYTICFVFVADFCFHSKYLHVRFFIFLSYFFYRFLVVFLTLKLLQ